MYVGEISTKQLISIALMLLFAFAAMFFIGYQYSYNKAIKYANEQIEESIEQYKIDHSLKSDNPDYLIGNIKLPDWRDIENEK